MCTPIFRLSGAGQRQQGMALIEVLVSLLVASVGILGFIGMHLQLRANADVAKQRSEAVRIAQQDMERLRLFRSLKNPDGTKPSDYWGGEPSEWDASFRTASGTPTGNTITDSDGHTLYAANTTYTLARSVAASNVAGYKELQVKVIWSDRQGREQFIVLRSVIENTDPSVAVSLGIAPNGSPVKDLLGRNVQVPIPAKNLGKTSVFKPTSDATVAYIFDNQTGEISETCTVDSTVRTAQLNTGSLNNCTDTKAYLLSGFIRFGLDSYKNKNFDPSTANDAQPSSTTWGAQLSLDSTEPPKNAQGAADQGTLQQLTSSWWTSINHAGYDAPSCYAEYSKTISYTGVVSYTNTNNGSTATTTSSTFFLTVPAGLALTPEAVMPYDGVRTSGAISNVKDTGERYVAYSCIVYPIDLDKNLDSKAAWTGRPLVTVTGASIEANASGYKVCRFSADYNKNGYVWKPAVPPASSPATSVTHIDNEEHPYAYLNVTEALSNQNYLIIKGDAKCPNLQTDSGCTGDVVEINGTGNANYTDATTVLHQP